MKRNQERVQELFAKADVLIGGSRPWDIQVLDDRFYHALVLEGSLGLGESYMRRWWEAGALDEFFDHLLKARLEKHNVVSTKVLLQYLTTWFSNLQNPRKASLNVGHHYDIGNDLYKAMLDKRLMYSCAYWKDAHTLDEAQEAKMDLICRKLVLQEGQRILDIGCGWGGFAKYASEKYGVKVVGVTLSQEQFEYGKKICQGLPVEIKLLDYRSVEGKFDHVVSIGMFEHVGWKNYRTFMKTAARVLSDEGRFLLHTIGGNISKHTIDPWVHKYIFPNAVIPSIKQVGQALEDVFVMEDWQNFGPYYDKTLMAWFENLDRHWLSLQGSYSNDFYRMWKYYLLSCAGSFRARKSQLWQIVLTKRGLEQGFSSDRYETSRPAEIGLGLITS